MITPKAGILGLIVTGIIALTIAYLLGKFRHVCRIVEDKAPWKVPLIWHKTWFRIISWLIVTITSVWFAGIVALFIEVLINKWLGRFTFGVVLVARWQLSGLMATIQAEKMVPGIMDDHYPLTREEVEKLDRELEETKKVERGGSV